EEADSRDLGQALDGAREESALPGSRVLAPDPVEKLERRREADSTFEILRSGLEARWRVGEIGGLEAHRAHHAAPGQERRHLSQNLGAREESADAARPVDLVTREGVEVAAER